jgi:hypothetical protein
MLYFCLCVGLPRDLYLQVFRVTFSIKFPFCSTYPAHLILHGITLLTSSVCIFLQPPDPSSLCGPDIPSAPSVYCVFFPWGDRPSLV